MEYTCKNTFPLRCLSLQLIILLICCPVLTFSQGATFADTVSPSSIYSVGIGVHYGFVFAHAEEVQNTKGSKPWGIELDLNKQLLKNESWEACNCFPRTGLVISYFNFDNEILGHSINAGWYIEPLLFTAHRINLSLKGVAGLSYLTHPYDETENPQNQSYSMSLSAYLGLGLGINYKVSRKIQSKISIYYNHISNGGLKDPNYGINWPCITLHVFYLFNPGPLPHTRKDLERNYKNQPLRKDLLVYLTQRNGYSIWGGSAGVSRQISGMNALTFAGEVTADHALENRMKEDGNEEKSFVYAGLMVGHEFLMGRFNFSQQIGGYVYNASKYYKAIYQRYGLTYSLSNLFSFGINLKAHGKEANFVDGRIVFSFR